MAEGINLTALDRLAEYKKSKDFFSLELRLSLADLLMKTLTRVGWTQRRLAAVSGIDEPTISNIVTSGRNWEVDTAGALLWALGVHAKLQSVDAIAIADSRTDSAITTACKWTSELSHGKKDYIIKKAHPTSRKITFTTASSNKSPGNFRRGRSNVEALVG
jgi:transcriptional regulator with XRE-family HTH domain